jgi:hypothetical protein
MPAQTIFMVIVDCLLVVASVYQFREINKLHKKRIEFMKAQRDILALRYFTKAFDSALKQPTFPGVDKQHIAQVVLMPFCHRN